MYENEPIGRESILKYRITPKYLEATIEVVEITRETDASVFIRDRYREKRESKFTEWHEYHPTWEEAHAALLARAEAKVMSARRQLEVANSKYGNINGMKKP